MRLRLGSLYRRFSTSGAYAPSGAVCPRPAKIYRTPVGFLGLFVVVTPFLYLGTKMAEQFAGMLERYNLFVPDDDDD